MSRLSARLVMSTICAVALAGCGSSNEAQQLAEAQAAASEAAASQQAQRDAAALRARDNEQSLEAFYAGDDAPDDAGEPDDGPADDGGPSAPQPPSIPDAAPPAYVDAGGPPPPIPPVQ